nr:RNA-directed DNA polymerase, eukaryota, reverse transcriptase zinc-binding domain protein [Tanacetum cinerariifolium]
LGLGVFAGEGGGGFVGGSGSGGEWLGKGGSGTIPVLQVKLKDLCSASNMYVICKNNGFADLKIDHVGGSWIWIQFPMPEACDNFRLNTTMINISSAIKTVTPSFKVEFASLPNHISPFQKRFRDFFLTSRKMPLGSNSSFITLIPKLSIVVDKIVRHEKFAFITIRQILDGPSILSEAIDWYKKRKKKMFLFKVDFEKAFDQLFRLEQKKNCLVVDRISNGQYSWNWSRSTLGIRNSSYLNNMLAKSAILRLEMMWTNAPGLSRMMGRLMLAISIA